jgi:hypothetical protein
MKARPDEFAGWNLPGTSRAGVMIKSALANEEYDGNLSQNRAPETL